VTAGGINASDISVGNINFTGNLYQNGSIFVSGTGGGSGVSSQWTSTNGNLYYTTTAGNSLVGINTSSPSSSLDVIGSARFTVGLTTGTILATGLVSASSVNATTVSAGTAAINNARASNVTTTNLLITNMSIGSVIATNADINSLSSTNASIGSVLVTDINSTSVSTANFAATNGIVTNITSSNIVATNISSANSVVTTLVAVNVSFGSLLVDNGSDTTKFRVTGSHPDSAVIIHQNTRTNGLTYNVGSVKDSIAGNGYSIYDVTNNRTRFNIAEDGQLGIKTNSDGGIINFFDPHHAIWGRKGQNGQNDVMQFREYGDFEFFNGGFLNAQTRKMLIRNDGVVSASTLALSGDLHASNVSVGTISASGGVSAANLRITNIENKSIVLADFGTEGSWAIGANNGAMQYQVGAGAIGAHVFYTNSTTGSSNEAMGTERMRINGVGNVGIGINNPSNKLHVVGDVLINGLITVSNVVATNMSSGTLNASNINAPSLTATNISVGTILSGSISATSASLTNIIATNVSSNNSVITNMSASSLNAGSINASNVTSTNISTGALRAVGVTATNISVGALIASGQASLSSITTGNINASGDVRINGDLYVGGSVTAVNITSENLIENNISSGTLIVSGLSSLQNVTAANLYGSNVYATLVSSSNLAANNATASNLISNNISSANVYSTLVSSANISGLNGNINSLASNLITVNNLIVTNITNNSLYIFNSATSGNVVSMRAFANITSGSRIGSVLGKNLTTANALHTWYEHVGDANNTNYVHYDFVGADNILVMNAQGRVGINTTAPTDRLHVNGSLRVGTIITAPNLIATNASIGTLVSTLVNTTNLVATNISTAKLVTTDITSINLVTTSASIGALVAAGNSNTLGSLFTVSGNVGINTTSPGAKLDIQNNGSVQINIQNVNAVSASRLKLWAHDDKNSYIQSSGDLIFADLGQTAPRLAIATTGNVGVGTNTPSDTLHVNGSLRVTGLITASNVITTNITSNNLVITNITANGIVSLKSTRGILIGTSNNIDDGRFISALDSGLANDSTRWIAWGQGASTNNQAELGFRYIGSGNTANSLLLGLYGGEKMRIQANGFVGIGRSSPAFKLDVLDGTSGDVMRIQNTSSIGYATIKYEANGSSWYTGVGGSTAGGGYANKYYITGPNNAKFVGQTNGTWGINTDSPTSTLQINGSLAKTSGTFDIKHPTKENKRLIHSFVEGPRCDLIYRGRKQLVNGQAIVNIDLECTSSIEGSMSEGTFEALCANPQVFVRSNTTFEQIIGSVANNKLTILSDNTSSNTIIDWMVLAERKDEDIKKWDKTDANGFLITEYDV
jgi:hypothetical protein